jgi:fructuronate reductase
VNSSPPARLVHLGLGNFFRAHQAWYTQHAEDGAAWSYTAFTGRSPDLAEALAAQDGRYTLLIRGAEADHYEVIDRVATAHPAAAHDRWLAELAAPEVAVVTITVTEAAYLRGSDGGADHTDPQLSADIDALTADAAAPVTTVPARLVAGLLARRAAGAGPVAIVPCDNLSENGAVVAGVVRSVAERVDASLLDWLGTHTSFVTTMVDRITPATTAEDRTIVARDTGWDDQVPVVTEPFSEWVLQGEFPAGRPAWETAGATFTGDIDPFERRKLTLLNGAHSLLAYAGPSRGHGTVADAVGDPVCRRWVEQWWDEAARHLPLPAEEVAAYREALLTRFANPRMRHLLSQIAADGSQKLAVRIVPTLLRERDEGRVPEGATRAVAAWLWHLREQAGQVTDAHATEVLGLAAGPLVEAVRQVLTFLDSSLSDDAAVVEAVTDHARGLGTR